MVKKISGIIGLILLSIVMYIFMEVQVTIDSPNTDKPIIKEEEVNEVSEWITIPTYDGANEVTHPKILYFKDLMVISIGWLQHHMKIMILI